MPKPSATPPYLRTPHVVDSWEPDADGHHANLCSICGTPVMYGSRHTKFAHPQDFKKFEEIEQGSFPRYIPIPSRLQMLIERYADAYHRYLKYSAPSEYERTSLTKAKTELEHEIRSRLTC